MSIWQPIHSVLCHLPSDVKGIGNKSDDFHAAFGCAACHAAIDQHKLSTEAELFYSFRALQRTFKIWVESGIIEIPISKPRKPTSSKILPRRPSIRQESHNE